VRPTASAPNISARCESICRPAPDRAGERHRRAQAMSGDASAPEMAVYDRRASYLTRAKLGRRWARLLLPGRRGRPYAAANPVVVCRRSARLLFLTGALAVAMAPGILNDIVER